jgi:lysozyme
MESNRPARRTAAFVLATTLAVLATILQTPPSAAAAFVCPVEDRSTRPNNGGPAVSTFPVKGIDVSHWNSISWSAAKTAGVRFAYLKATQGKWFIDSTYASKQAAARKVGIRVGAYHFFDYRYSGRVQADWFINAVKARGGFTGRLRPVIDVECSSPLGRPSKTYAAIRLRQFVTRVRERLGVRPIIYTSIFEWNTVTGGNATFGDCALWSAEWAKTAPLKFPPGWTRWTFWQYGLKTVGTKRVDGNVFNGDLDALARWVRR